MRYYFILIVSLFLWGTSAPSYAQISINFNIGVQPVWGPTGYDYVEYYYLPDIDCYYYVPQHRFYYFFGGRWIYRSSLPPQYSHYDLYNSYKVVVNEREPWRHNDNYRQKYASYKGRHDQQPIRDSRDTKYFVNPKHPQHNAYLQQQKGNDGSRIGQNKGNVAPMGNNNNRIGQNKGNVAPMGNNNNRTGQNKGNVAPRGNTGNNKAPVIRQNTGNQKPTMNNQNTRNQRPPVVRQNTGNQRPPVVRQNTGNQRPPVVKQNSGNNGNKGNGGKGNDNGKGNDKGNGKGK